MLKKILLGTVGASALTFAAMPAAHAAIWWQVDGGEGAWTSSTNVLCAKAFAETQSGTDVEKVVVWLVPSDGDGATRKVVDITPGNGHANCQERDVQNGDPYRMVIDVFVAGTNDTRTWIPGTFTG